MTAVVTAPTGSRRTDGYTRRPHTCVCYMTCAFQSDRKIDKLLLIIFAFKMIFKLTLKLIYQNFINQQIYLAIKCAYFETNLWMKDNFSEKHNS